MIIPLIQISIITQVQVRLFSIFGLPLKFGQAYKHNFISSIFLFIIPGFFAPDIYLAHHYGSSFNNYSKVISGLFLNRLLGFLIFCLFALIGLIIIDAGFLQMFDLNLRFSFYQALIFVAVGVIGAILLIIFRKKMLRFFQRLSEHFTEVKKELSQKKSDAILIIILKILRYTVGLSVRIYFARILGIEIPLLYMAGIIMIMSLLVSLPISINGIGVREIGYIGLLSIAGINEDIGLTLSFLDFSLLLSTAFIGFIFYMLKITGANSLKKGGNHHLSTRNIP